MSSNPWLRRFALATAVVTLGLIGIGGLVTSHEAGMAVPDWPNTYGYNMFLFPVSKWIGGILYEHSHRLVASLVGLLTTILAIWCWARETQKATRWAGILAIVMVILLMGVRRLPVYVTLASLAPVVIVFGFYRIRRHRDTAGLRWWGMIALAAVILQGVLGGLRVVLFKDEIGILHAALAQIFFVLICLMALFTTEWWQRLSSLAVTSSPLSRLLTTTTALIFLQLLLGATMRHQHAGLAIPDFPLAYGKLWPAMDNQSVLHYNQQRVELIATNAVTGFQIGLQMAHRILALAILAAVAFSAWFSRRSLGGKHPVSRLGLFWLCLVVGQGVLGAATIWSNKAADIATGHVMIGALCLMTGALLTTIARRSALGVVAPVPAERALPIHAHPAAARNFP